MLLLLSGILIWVAGIILAILFLVRGLVMENVLRHKRAVCICVAVIVLGLTGWGGWNVVNDVEVKSSRSAGEKVAADITRCARSARVKVDVIEKAYANPDQLIVEVPWDDDLWSYNELVDIRCGKG